MLLLKLDHRAVWTMKTSKCMKGIQMKKQSKRKFSSEEKANALKRHLVGKESISTICEDLSIGPGLFYRWQNELFENADVVFERKQRGSRTVGVAQQLQQQVGSLEERLTDKDNVIAEITEDYVRLKKKFGHS